MGHTGYGATGGLDLTVWVTPWSQEQFQPVPAGTHCLPWYPWLRLLKRVFLKIYSKSVLTSWISQEDFPRLTRTDFRFQLDLRACGQIIWHFMFVFFPAATGKNCRLAFYCVTFREQGKSAGCLIFLITGSGAVRISLNFMSKFSAVIVVITAVELEPQVAGSSAVRFGA